MLLLCIHKYYIHRTQYGYCVTERVRAFQTRAKKARPALLIDRTTTRQQQWLKWQPQLQISNRDLFSSEQTESIRLTLAPIITMQHIGALCVANINMFGCHIVIINISAQHKSPTVTTVHCVIFSNISQ